MADPTLKVKIQVDGQDAAAAGVKKVKAATDELGGSSKKLATEQDGLGAATRATTSAMSAFGAALSIAALVKLSRDIATAKDEMAAMRQQALMMSGSTQGFEALYASAQRLGVGLKDASQAVNFFAPALAKLGKSYEQSIEFSENLTKSMRVYGLEGQAASSVTTQLAQALSSGTLGGDELKSLRENAGGLAMKLEEAIQQVLGTTDSLKDLGSQGRLSSEVVATAWEKVFRDLKGNIAGLPDTLAQQESRMGNAAMLLMEALDKQLHVSDIWNWFETGLTSAMETAANSLNPPSLGANLDAVVRLNAEIAKAQVELEKLRNATPFRSSGVPGSYIGDKLIKGAGGTKEEEERILQRINELEKQRATYIELQATDSEVLFGHEERQLEQAKEKARIASDTAAAEKAWSDSKISRAEVESAFGREAAATLERMLPTITAMAEKYNLSEAAIIAMAKAESDFSQQATSGKGAVGVMQMTAAAAEQVAARTGLSFAQMRDGWKENIEGGAAYMRWLLDNSKGAIKNMDDLARAYNAGLGGMNKGFVETENHGNKVSAAYEKLTTAGKSSTEMMAEATAAAKQQADAHAKAATEAERLAIAQRQIDQVPIDAQNKIDAYLAGQQEQLRVAGLTTEEKIRSAEASKIEAMALDEEHKAVQALVQGNTELAEAHRQAAERIREGSKAAEDNAVAISKMAASAKAAAPSIADLWNNTVLEMSKSIQTSLTDAFTGLFDGTIKNASSFLESLKKVVIRGLANLASAILMNPINVVINATLVGAAGNAQAGQTTVQSAYNDAGGGWGGVLGAGKYLTGGNSIGATMAGYMGDAAAKFGLASEGLLSAGQSLAATSNLMLGAGSVLGSVAGNLIFQGKGYSEIGSSIGATAGTVIGSMLIPVLGPFGPIIGGLLGGIGGGGLGSLFGDEDPPTPETIYIQQKGGYFETTQEINSNHETLQKVQEAEQALNDLTGALADILGPEAAKVRNERNTVNQSLHPEEIGAWLTEQTKYTVGEMIAASTGAMKDLLYKAWVDSGYDIETILPIAQEAKALLDNLPAITEEMLDAGMNLGDDAEKAALQLLILAGGIENLTASQAAYADLFIGPEERMQNVAKALGEEFEKLNMTLPASRGELRRMVDALDLTVEENVKARLTILGMADTLDEYYTSMEDGEEATSGFIFVFEEFIARLKDTEDALSEAKNSYNTLFVTPEDEMARLSLELAKAFEAFGFVLPDTRDGLQSLVDSFDLTTESGRLAYIGVMQLAAELDAFYNSLDDGKDVIDNYLNVVQQYYDLFTDDDQKLADQIQWLADAFEVLGLVLPPTREEFKKLIETLTEEQRRLLAENENILGRLDDYYKEQDRLAEEQKQREEEARREAEEAQRKAIEDQKQMISEAHNDRLEALNEESQAAQEALQKINGVVSSLKSAIASFRLDKDILDQSTFQASRDQLVAWSKGKGLPEQEALDKTLGGLSSFDKNSYATQADYARDYWTTMGALTELERRGLKQQTAAEKMVDNLQKQIDLENEWYQAEMERMDELVAAVGEIKAAVAPVAAPGTAPPEQQPNAPSTAAQMAELIAEVKSWRESQRMEAVDMATYQKRSADTLRKWDDEGMPDNREGTTYLKVA